ncbi:MAG: hypothetical protein ACI8XW_003626 [Gammaproteobacteria bacterium]|jgi:hypothetical protein
MIISLYAMRARFCCCRNQFLLLILGIGLQLPLYAATSTATVTANIVRPISMSTQNGMEFNDVESENSAGTVVLSPNGSRIATGGIGIKSSKGGEPATFKVEGEPNAVYTISLPPSVVMTDSVGNTMIVDNFTSLPAAIGSLDTTGQQTLYVGGTLNVKKHQEYGPYSGAMSVTIQYN